MVPRRASAQDAVIAAYRADIDRLMAEAIYQAVDVVSLTPEHPDKAMLRQEPKDVSLTRP